MANQGKNQTDAATGTAKPVGLDVDVSAFTARRKKCDVCGATWDVGKMCMKLTSTEDKGFLVMDMNCWMGRHTGLVEKQINAALERRFPNLTKYWREQHEKGNNEQDNNNEGNEDNQVSEKAKSGQDGDA